MRDFDLLHSLQSGLHVDQQHLSPIVDRLLRGVTTQRFGERLRSIDTESLHNDPVTFGNANFGCVTTFGDNRFVLAPLQFHAQSTPVNPVLRLRIEHDPDGTAELFVELLHPAFTGRASAWFDATRLTEFGTRLAETFPLAKERPIELVGGYWSRTGDSIEQLHVGLRFYPIGGTGTVGVYVQLATDYQADERPESQCKVAAEIKTNYEELRRFGLAVKALAQRQTSLAELNEHSH
ncbi:hypothetical protein [Acidovorax sp.]|uniref:hypothetical protein n=1 Tax=Acidovorax sp. TaxID=1872122 RepID=UPI00262E2D47|nr:hypothetical protein [Acidovorax sp.]